MEISWIELHPESRDFEINRQGISKNFVFVITAENNDFIDNATTEYLPTTSLILYNDDAVVQEQVLAVFWQQIPIFFEFVVDNNFVVLLWISSLRATQLNWNQWKVECTFDIPFDNGNNQGKPDEPPDTNGEKNSEEYTQISFNAVVAQEKRQIARVADIQLIPADIGNTGRLTYADSLRGKRILIGKTDDSIEGFEVNVRNFSFSLTQYMKPTKLTYAYVRRLARLVGSINNAEFFGFAPWSVMCVGMDGSGTVYSAVPVKLDFEVKPNFRFERVIPTRGSGPTLETGTPNLLPPIEDTYFPPNLDLISKVDTTKQYIRLFEDEFFASGTVNNSVNHTTASLTMAAGLEPGVHSGWSQIFYEYVSKVVENEKALVRVPVSRIVYLPDEYIPADFNDFLL